MLSLPKILKPIQYFFYRIVALFVVLLIVWPVAAYSSARVAMVLDVAGSVTLISEFDGFEDESPLMRTNYLLPGNKLRLSKGGRVTLLHLEDLQRYIFKGPDEILVDANHFRGGGGQVRSEFKKSHGGAILALLAKNRRVLKNPQAVIGVRDVGGKKVGDILLYTPNNQEKILDKYPEFHWNDASGTHIYRFILKTKEGVVLLDQAVSTPFLHLPKRIKLIDGHSYRWQVVSDVDHLHSLEWSFVVASQEERVGLDLLYPAENKPISDHVLYGVFLEKMGFLGEAKKQWRTLQKRYPEDSFFKKRAR